MKMIFSILLLLATGYALPDAPIAQPTPVYHTFAGPKYTLFPVKSSDFTLRVRRDIRTGPNFAVGVPVRTFGGNQLLFEYVDAPWCVWLPPGPRCK
jgi:hypothetical protein